MTRFEIKRELIDVTSDGTLGIPPDVMRRKIACPPSYFVDGVEVTRERFEASLRWALANDEELSLSEPYWLT